MNPLADVTTWVDGHSPEQQEQIRWLADRVHGAAQPDADTRVVREAITHQTEL